MSEQAKHTRTPWRCSNRSWRNEVDPHRWYVTGDHRDYDEDDSEEDRAGDDYTGSCVGVARVEGNPTSAPVTEMNARRIVACVNACEGLPTASLEKMAREVAVGELVVKAAALLTACEAALTELEGWQEASTGLTSGNTPLDRLVTMLRGAVGKARGEV